jgi:hypothetical protein
MYGSLAKNEQLPKPELCCEVTYRGRPIYWINLRDAGGFDAHMLRSEWAKVLSTISMPFFLNSPAKWVTDEGRKA